MYDLIIIGGGPAALSAAAYAAGKRLNAVMIYQELGGKIGWLESLIGPDQSSGLPGNDLVHLLSRRSLFQAKSALHDRVCSVSVQPTTFSVETEAHGALVTQTLLIATGARPLPLAVPGAERFVQHGLGYSTTTHGHLFAGKRVAVIGDATRALSGAAELAANDTQVTLIAPSPLPAASPLTTALRACPNVRILENSEVLEVIGDDAVQALLVQQAQHTERIAVDQVFVTLGVVPNSELVRDVVRTTEEGHILITKYHETSLPGLFAAGDVTSIFSEQVLVAIGDGARAARTAYEYLLVQTLKRRAVASNE